MKQIYQDIALTTGRYRAGICAVSIVPKEWLAAQVEADYLTGIITEPLDLQPGKEWIVLDLVDSSYEYDEKPKNTKAGDFFDISLDGIINDISPTTLQSLVSLRQHQFVSLLKDKQGRLKLVGNKDEGMALNWRNLQNNDQGGTQRVSISMAISLATPAPFYVI